MPIQSHAHPYQPNEPLESEEPKRKRTGDSGPQPAKVQPPPPIKLPISFDEDGFEGMTRFMNDSASAASSFCSKS